MMMTQSCREIVSHLRCVFFLRACNPLYMPEHNRVRGCCCCCSSAVQVWFLSVRKYSQLRFGQEKCGVYPAFWRCLNTTSSFNGSICALSLRKVYLFLLRFLGAFSKFVFLSLLSAGCWRKDGILQMWWDWVRLLITKSPFFLSQMNRVFPQKGGMSVV